MNRIVSPTAFAAACAAALAAAPAAAQETGDASAGETLYQTFCATCHGVDAIGGGPMAEVLTVTPPDLTRLAQRNEGVFPTARVVTQIDGRDRLLSHGGEMPIFGGYFEGEDAAMKTPQGMPILTSQPIIDLVTWLMSVQE